MKALVWIVFACVAAVIIGGAAYYFLPAGAVPTGSAIETQSAAKPVSFTVIKQGADAPHDLGRVNYRITTDADYQKLWGILYGVNAPAQPAVDFDKLEVLAVFDGTHSTGGYEVNVTSVMDGASRMITVRHGIPDADCAVTSAVTAPYVLITVPRTTLPLTHGDSDETNACQ